MKTMTLSSLRGGFAVAVVAYGMCGHGAKLWAQQAQASGMTPAQREAESARSRDTVPAGRKKIGIALEGGGALGIAHVGVVKWLFEHHVPIDRVAGTSMGALIGSLVASGHSIEEIQRLTVDGNIDDMFTLKPSLSRVSFRQREDRDSLPQALTFGLRNGKISPGTALIADDQLNAFLAHELVGYNSENLSFDEMPIPFRCVATDLTTLQPAVFQSGSLPLAVRASISIPGVFPPVHYHGDMLVDGAIVDNLPTDVLRNELHADVVIAVHLSDAAFEEKDATSLLGIFARAFQAGTNRNEQISRSLANIEILPDVKSFSSSDYSKGPALLKAGYEATEKARDQLLPYAISDEEWALYLASMKPHQRRGPERIDVVRVQGPDRAVSARIERKTDGLAGKPFDVSKAESIVSDIRGAGAVDAYYATFHTEPAGAAAGTVPAGPDNAIDFHWRPRVEGPPYLQLGTDVVAMNSNVTAAVFNIRLLDENLGGYGSELRSDFRLGYLTSLHTEYYRPIGNTDFFLQPHIQLDRDPVYLWENQKRVSERFLQRAGGGLDFGLTLNRNFQTDIEYRDATIRWALRDGSDTSPTQHVSGVVSSVAVHAFYSDRTAEIASPRGSQVEITVGHLLAAPSSPEAPFMKLSAMHSFLLAQKNVISVSVDANTYFRNDVADPLRFTLGGPLHLYASSVGEYRGTDTAIARAFYLRRIARLPTGLGQGVYLTTGYEAGNIWSPEQHSILRQDGMGGVLVNTPLGAITMGGAVGDAGHRKVFFTFGRLF